MGAMGAHVVSVNVGTPREHGTSRGRVVMSAIGKQPVAGRVRVAGVNVAGDDQADRRVHGGPDQAVYGYAAEDAAWWAQELGRDIPPGLLGENLTTRGIDHTTAVIGERWRVGEVVLEVSAPRIPCAKLGRVMGTQTFVKRFGDALRPGAYFRIVEEGDLAAGDAIERLSRPDHGVTIRDVADILLHDKARLPELVDVPQLAERLRSYVRTL